jgi:ribosomal protein S18 acetylase RimI-like enzyme
MSIHFRLGNKNDLEFVVNIDLLNEGISKPNPLLRASDEAKLLYFRKISQFVDPSLCQGTTEFEKCPKYALICEEDQRKIGLLMFLLRDMNDTTFQHFGVFDKFPRNLFPKNGKVCEIFQFWVAPESRRKGIGTELTRRTESISVQNGVILVYTHTEVTNLHVVELYKKLGYQVIRTGRLDDEIIRVSMIKHLSNRGKNYNKPN